MRVPGLRQLNQPVFEFTGGECFGFDDLCLYADTPKRWRIASKQTHMLGGVDICYALCDSQKNNCLPMSGKHNSWKLFNGTNWYVFAMLMTVHIHTFD